MAVDNTQTYQNDVMKVLDKIKAEMMERKQFRLQEETNKLLSNVGQQLSKLNHSLARRKETQKAPDIKIPSVMDFVNGFSKASPIFSKEYSTWMKDSIGVVVAGNQELERIALKVDDLGSILKLPGDETSTEYLDLIATQIKTSGEDSLQRLDKQEESLHSIVTEITRVGNLLDGIQRDDLRSIQKTQRQELTLLYGIGDKIGKVGGNIVGTLTRIFDNDQKWREKEEMRRAEEDKERGGHPVAENAPPARDDSPPSDSSGIGAAIAGMLGLNALKNFLFAPFKAIGKVVGTFFGMFSKFGEGLLALMGPFGKVLKFLKVGPLALLSMVIDFGKGFFNAKEILGKASVTIVDRVRAGISELVGGFGDLFDWVAKIFGFDSDMGKKFREVALSLTEKPAEWLNGLFSWISDNLFAGITKNTSLTAIPGKLADNLQAQLIKLVDWISEGFSSFVDEGISVAGKVMDNIKGGFGEHIKKPFFNMLNALTNAMFDLVDKFVSLIPDALGGESARQKMAEARAAMTITADEGQQPTTPETTTTPTPDKVDTGTETPPPAPEQPKPETKQLTPLPPEAPATEPLDKTAQLKSAYGSLGGGSLDQAKPTQGRAASNIDQMKSAYAQQAPTVIAPVQQNVNNAKNISTTNNYNSTSLEPSNQTDKARILWDW